MNTIDYMTNKEDVMKTMLEDMGLTLDDFATNEVYKHHGRFEGCTLMDLYFYWASLNGDGCTIKVTETDRKLWSHLGAMVEYVVIEESSDGFLFFEYMTAIGLERYESELKDEDENIPCESCGNRNLPLHTDSLCPNCHTKDH